MYRSHGNDNVVPEFVSCLFERLRELRGYVWDETRTPFQNSYDNWHVFGERRQPPSLRRDSPPFPSTSRPGRRISTDNRAGNAHLPASEGQQEARHAQVVARISNHTLKLERQYQVAKTLIAEYDPLCQHIVRPIECVRLPPRRSQESSLAVLVFEAQGENYLMGVEPLSKQLKANYALDYQIPRSMSAVSQMPLVTFLEFAIGAAECLEILHHGKESIVHGELRADAFHYNYTTASVKILNFGSGVRAFERGLTSAGWSALSRDAFARQKLQFIAPEQTGRMPATPDSRTDIYSLGILFYALLTGEIPFDDDSPLEIMQNVLSHRITRVASRRFDVPMALSSVIQKMTQKAIGDRYHSTSGLKWDLQEIQRLLGEGDCQALEEFSIGKKDVSCFFHLPSTQIGRTKERDILLSLIDKVSKQQKHIAQVSKGCSRIMSSATSTSADRADAENTDEITSVSIDTMENTMKKLLSEKPGDTSNARVNGGALEAAREPADQKPGSDQGVYLNGHSSLQSKVSLDSFDSLSRPNSHQAYSNGAGSLLRNKQKYSKDRANQKGRSEICFITGSAGMGKSCLVQSVQAVIRRRGYFASAKLQAKRSPFDSILEILGSLFRQVFSESDVSSQFHRDIRDYAQPSWKLLYPMLGLPAWLLGDFVSRRQDGPLSEAKDFTLPDVAANKTNELHCGDTGATPADFLRSGSSVKCPRLVNTVLDVLRFICLNRFVCAHLDDVHFVDNSNFEALQLIATANIPILLLITYRHENAPLAKLRASMQRGSTSTTRIRLGPLEHEEVATLIMATLHRPREAVEPLAKYLLHKTNGNPFFIRELLESWNQKGAIWFSFQSSMWEYDLRKASIEFDSQKCGSHCDTNFIVNRLANLPAYARSLLAWASLLGSTFSFNLVKQLMVTEYGTPKQADAKDRHTPVKRTQLTRHTSSDAVAGLNAALAAHVIVPGEEENVFSFSHDRFREASASLPSTLSPTEKHFVIVQTLAKYPKLDDGNLYIRVEHVCQSTELIKRNIPERAEYRHVLYRAAEKACESGDRKTALPLFSAALALLQLQPWNESQPDVHYKETLMLYIRTAECNWYLGHFATAHGLLAVTFDQAKDAVDKAPSWVLQSKMYAHQGDNNRAFSALKGCLADLGINVKEEATWEECDAEFQRLKLAFQTINRTQLLSRPLTTDTVLVTLGPVLVDMLSAVFWTDSLLFYQMSLLMLRIHLEWGTFTQIPIGYVCFASICIGRFNMLDFGIEMSEMARQLLSQFQDDAYTVGRGETLRSWFCGHYQTHIREQLPLLERAMEATIHAGDRILSILNLGVIAITRLWASFDVADVEAFATFGPEEFLGWEKDMRGGSLLLGVRQYCRAMQGKTSVGSAAEVLDDDEHQTRKYLQFLDDKVSNPDRPKTIYQCYQLSILFHFGHLPNAKELGERLIVKSRDMWCMRHKAMVLWYLCLSSIAFIRENAGLSNESELKKVEEYRQQLASFTKLNDVNYLAWISLVNAEYNDIIGNQAKAIECYEVALDHAQVYDFTFEKRILKHLVPRMAAFRDLMNCSDGIRTTKDDTNVVLIIKSNIPTASEMQWPTICLAFRAFVATCRSKACQFWNIEDHGPTTLCFLLEFRASLTIAGALAFELYACFTARCGGKRLARCMLLEAIAAYNRLGATGKAEQIAQQHEFILRSSISEKAIDVGCQTSWVDAGNGVSDLGKDEVQEYGELEAEAPADRTAAWLAPQALVDGKLDEYDAAMGLDIIDLASILESSQVLSSTLQLDDLLTKMTEIILESSGAELSGIVVKDDDVGWNVAAVGENNHGISAKTLGQPLETGENQLAKQVTLYAIRFREVVFLHNLLDDERFSHVSEAWLARNPGGKSVIAIPILHGDSVLLGCLYVQGAPNSFTDRNLNVLRLLTNQIGISIANALLFKKLEKAKAENLGIIESQKRALAQTREALRLKEEAMAAKNVFLANTSHELRTPLNGVIGMSQLLMGTSLSTEQIGYTESVRVCADTLLQVINDILDYSKLEAGKMQMFAERMNLVQTINEVVRALSFTNSKERVETVQRVHLDPKLYVIGDPVRLHQCFMNLISNAYKFTKEGTVTVGAVVNSDDTENVQVTFSVADTGVGISKETRTKLFKPFSQADSSTARTYGGTGLGLSICKAIIENLMNGRIWMESTLGAGTTVFFQLKFAKAAQTNGAVETPRIRVSETIGRASGSKELLERPSAESKTPIATIIDLSKVPRNQLRVCICEDNPINSKIAVSFVKKLGLTCSAYVDGAQGVAALEEDSKAGNPFHIVLMDCQMPVLDGYDATRAIRRHNDPQVSSVLVIALTASAIQGDREKCLDAGMDDYLTKPIRVQVLRDMVEGYLRGDSKEKAGGEEVDGIGKEADGAMDGDLNDGEGEMKSNILKNKKLLKSNENGTKLTAVYGGSG